MKVTCDRMIDREQWQMVCYFSGKCIGYAFLLLSLQEKEYGIDEEQAEYP